MNQQPPTLRDGRFTPSSGASAEATEQAALPASIGRYRIHRILGEGGMGRVYLAEQREPVARFVALKVLRPFGDSPDHVARLIAEAQALARLQHPYVAQVFDAGRTEQGLPFLVMEHLEGHSITEHCDERRLPIEDRLRLMIKVCEGIQHAHQKGIIHRDLKPSNILVGTAPPAIPKIIDFGLAKEIDTDVQRTVAGQAVGTPSYMSPEQLEGFDGGVDTRTDVYALGVILYELLVGELPHRRGDEPYLAYLQRVASEEPQRPSDRSSRLGEASATVSACRATEPAQLRRRLQGDLDWIALRAMEKDRERRYPTASELAADLQRHLDSQPVLAGPPTRSYRMAKFAKRHRAAVIAATVAASALLAATALSIASGLRAGRSEQRAIASEHEARRSAESAEAINRFLEELLSSVDPGRSGRDVKLLAAIDAKAGDLERHFGHQPELEASVRQILGKAYSGLGEYERAAEQLEVALRLREEALGPDHPATRQSLATMVDLAILQGDYGRAGELGERLLTACGNDPDTTPGELLESRFRLSQVSYKEGRYDVAEQDLSDILLQQRDLLGDDHPAVLRTMLVLAHVLGRTARLEESEQLYREILSSRQQTLGPDHPETLESANTLGNALFRQGRYEDAGRIYADVLGTRRRVLGEEHPATLLTANNVANCAYKEGRYEEAEELFRATLQIQTDSLGSDHPDTLLTMNNLGNSIRRQQRWGEAETLYSLARDGQRRLLGPGHIETIRTSGNLVTVRMHQGDWKGAKAVVDESLEAKPDFVDFWWVRGEIARSTGRPAEALAAVRHAAGLQPDSLEAQGQLAFYLLVLGEEGLARQQYETALGLAASAEEVARLLLGPLEAALQSGEVPSAVGGPLLASLRARHAAGPP